MKNQLSLLIPTIALASALCLTAQVAHSQVETTTTRTTSVGTVNTFSPDAITITANGAPVRYRSSKTTTYVDEAGNPVAVETVRSGAPVTVYYEGDADNRVATKIVVRKHVSTTEAPVSITSETSPTAPTTTTTTSTTSTAGTVTTFNPDTIAVQTTSSTSPVSYSSSKTTTYVDEAGNPVAVETVKSGTPVTVYYATEGDRTVASKVVIHTSTAPDGQVIEHKKTTTTTTTPEP